MVMECAVTRLYLQHNNHVIISGCRALNPKSTTKTILENIFDPDPIYRNHYHQSLVF